MDHHSPVRVRYAPSPTGLQHIGGVRTALFNYLFARRNGGKFILRIEDTDRVRSEERYIDDLYESLNWLGIQVDEGPPRFVTGRNSGPYLGNYGPYIQSERIEQYRFYTQKLIHQGRAYYCFCSSERLDLLRKQQEAEKLPLQGYDRLCRSLSRDEAESRRQAGEPYVVRLAIPLAEEPRSGPLETRFHDRLLGEIKRANRDINPDPVILKTDGFPTYHLANVIDDHLMGITHVLRAQEWLSSGPLHMLLYQAFGWEAPQFCHLPMVMGADGAKLSKRHGSTSLLEFREAGYLPAALVNYIALLGWSFDESREFFTLKELEECFELNKLSRSPAGFDYRKLEW
ncbi:MAG: glutamate--tRNA ligase, partial [Spirochaetota bacterium]